MRVDTIFGGPGPYGETYRLYYSSDHQNATASIGLLSAPSLSGPWTDHGQIFKDTSGGTQTENPSVVYDPASQTFFLFYHQVNATGSVASEVIKLATMSLATARVGDTWTISTVNGTGIVVDNPSNGAWPSNGGWGYFRPWRVGTAWFAHYRIGGAADLTFGLAKSRDGYTWRQDSRPLYFAAHQMNDPLGRFNPSSHFPDWGSGQVIQWKGNWWWIGVLLAYAVQYQSPQPSWVVMAPISRDFRQLLAVPTPIFADSQAWEAPLAGWPVGMGNHRYGMSAMVDSDGLIHVAYLNGQLNQNNDIAQLANFASGIGLAVSQ